MTCLGRDDDVFSPSDIKRLVASYAPRFLGYNQQDSQEFLRYALENDVDLNISRTGTEDCVAGFY
jgi:ubiquitin C-terminal hydrolase